MRRLARSCHTTMPLECTRTERQRHRELAEDRRRCVRAEALVQAFVVRLLAHRYCQTWRSLFAQTSRPLIGSSAARFRGGSC
jgi:hypothetical protein